MLIWFLAMLEDEEDRALFTRLHEKYEGKMYAVALSILKEHHLAEDCVHDAFCAIIQNFSKIDSLSCQKTGAWIVTIVKNTALNTLKKNRRCGELPETWDCPAPEGVEEGAGYRRLVELIRVMPEGYRRALELKFVLEWSNRDIARALGISESAAAQRISRGRALLQKCLREEGYVT